MPYRFGEKTRTRKGPGRKSPWLVLAALALAGPPGCALSRALVRADREAELAYARSHEPALGSEPSTRPVASPTDLRDASGAERTPTNDSSAIVRPKTDSDVVTTATPPEPSVIPLPAAEYPIDLSTALRLAQVENPEIAEARADILAALAVQQGARALLLPSLNAGLMYHGHTGNLQRSSGTILNLSEQSLYFGGGTRTVAAESLSVPAVFLASPLADALYAPLAARQDVARARFQASATANSVLLDVAVLHLELIYAEAHLYVQRQSESDANEVFRLTRGYFQTGEGPKSDADRALAEYRLRQSNRQHAEEEVAVASARLARRLHLDPTVRLYTYENRLQPISIVDLAADTEDLIQQALRQRPEMAAQAARIAQFQTFVRQEISRPLLPTIAVGYSGGAFGGGSNIVPPFLGNFGGRTDFDVRAFWTIQNFGFGNFAHQRRRRAQVGEAMAEQARIVNMIRREVTSAISEARASVQRVETAIGEVQRAEAGYREDYARILQRAEGALPIELLDSYELLARARVNLLQAIRDLDRTQFRLFVALGSPPPLGTPPATLPSPPPVAAPPLPALH